MMARMLLIYWKLNTPEKVKEVPRWQNRHAEVVARRYNMEMMQLRGIIIQMGGF